MRRGDGGRLRGCCGLCLDKYHFTPSIDFVFLKDALRVESGCGNEVGSENQLVQSLSSWIHNTQADFSLVHKNFKASPEKS